MTTFATNLRRLRHKAKLSQHQLDQASGLAFGTVAHYEAGRREPSLANLRALQEALQCGYPAFFNNKQQ
jgi:transcriptional regulator with XRE-family HTH domain